MTSRRGGGGGGRYAPATGPSPAKYSLVPSVKPPIAADEIRVSADGILANYLGYARRLLKEQPLIHIKATGNAVPMAISLAETLRLEQPALHQENRIKVVQVQDRYRPLEDGLDEVVRDRFLPGMEILLAADGTLVDPEAPGYQSPRDAEPVFLTHDQDPGARNFRGRPRGFSAGPYRGGGGGFGAWRGPGYGGGRGRGRYGPQRFRGAAFSRTEARGVYGHQREEAPATPAPAEGAPAPAASTRGEENQHVPTLEHQRGGRGGFRGGRGGGGYYRGGGAGGGGGGKFDGYGGGAPDYPATSGGGRRVYRRSGFGGEPGGGAADDDASGAAAGGRGRGRGNWRGPGRYSAYYGRRGAGGGRGSYYQAGSRAGRQGVTTATSTTHDDAIDARE